MFPPQISRDPSNPKRPKGEPIATTKKMVFAGLLVAIVALCLGGAAWAYLASGEKAYELKEQQIAALPKSLPTAERTPTGYWPAKTPAAASTPSTASTREQTFPDDLIRRKLARDYPDDYVAQKGVYEMQIEAFEYMKTIADSPIKRKVQRDYPNDFVAQKGVYDMQVEAKEQMQKRQ